MWLGHIDEFPNYITQRETREELQENLKDICSDPAGRILGVTH